MRLVLVTLLVSLTLLAGCTKQEDLVGEPIEPASTTVPTGSPTPAPTTAPPPRSPPPSSPPPPSTTPPPPTAPTPPSPPAVKADTWVNKSGWVSSNSPTDPNMTVKVPFPIPLGVRQLVADAYIQTVTPTAPTQLPASVPTADHPVALNITLVDPDGRIIGNYSYVQVGDGNYTSEYFSGARINITGAPVRAGDYVLVLNVQGGASDGTAAGDRYYVKIRMSYV